MTSTPPRSVDRAFQLLALALVAGIVEMAAHAQHGAAAIALRLLIYGAVLAVMLKFRRGASWARIALAVGLGVIGLASLTVEPIAWMLADNTLGPLTIDAVVIGCARAVHILAVVGAVVLMFGPQANRSFAAPSRQTIHHAA